MPSLSAASFEASLSAMPANASLRSAALLEWARSLIDQGIDKAGVENIVLTVQHFYDKHIAPLDVPWIPDAREPELIDLPAKWLIGQIIRGFHDLIHRDQPAPTTP